MQESLRILHFDEVDPMRLEGWLGLAVKRMPDVHKNRQREWALARLCLEDCLQDLGFKFRPIDLVFRNNHFLENFSQISFSLSHSKAWAAAFVAPLSTARQVGVDIELKKRKIPDNVKHRLFNSEDADMEALHMWVIKEAAYKSLPTLAQEGIWLNNIVVTESNFALQGSPFKGTYKFMETDDLMIAKAYY